MPRITDRYDFNFSNVTGPEAKVWTVNFYGTEDTSKVHTYLTSMGYKKQERCDVEAECWRAAGTHDVVTVATFDTDKSVVVQVYSSPYMSHCHSNNHIRRNGSIVLKFQRHLFFLKPHFALEDSNFNTYELTYVYAEYIESPECYSPSNFSKSFPMRLDYPSSFCSEKRENYASAISALPPWNLSLKFPVI